jgi:XTP/dITP diphosphohydrolase
VGSKREIVFITTNSHKVKEIKALADSESRDITIVHRNYEYPELQLDEVEEVVKASANYIREKIAIKNSFFIEDSGLFIHALHDFPGPFSAFVFKKIGNGGILKLMADKKGEARKATFKTAVAFCEAQKEEPVIFLGTAEGRIAEELRGGGGFGYDPIFEFDGKTFAEMSTEGKNSVSHRSRAFRKLLDYLS